MTTPTTCVRCGEPIPPGARFCARCGADISGAQGNVATAYVAPADLARATTPEAALLDQLRQATAGEYDVGGELGRGGMATVFLAHDLALDRKVAIKVMSPALLTGEGMAERFKREARTAASLSHPNIIPIYAVKQSAHLLYFVMKYVEGRPLDAVLKATGPLPVPLVQAILHQVGAALAHAHRRGIVHRDIKPANIMLDADGWTVVTDFGIAKVTESKGLTQTGATVGTPHYMSPEQCAATRELTGASDQYSLGIVAYEMLAGKPPFDADSLVGILYAQCHTPPAPVRNARPDLTPALAAAVMRMLEKDPAKRFAGIEEAVTALGGAPLGLEDPRRDEMILLAKAGDAAELRKRLRTPVSPVPSVPTTRVSAEARAPRRRGLMVAGGVAAAVIAAVLWLKPWAPPTPPETHTIHTQPPPNPAPTPARGEERPVVAPVAGARPQQLAGRDPAKPLGAAPRGDSAYLALRREAWAQRDRAAAAGASALDLAPGDVAAGSADTLSARGQFAGAVTRLMRAASFWASAQRRADARAADAAALAAQSGAPPSQPPAIARPDETTLQLQATIAEYARAVASRSIEQVRRVFPDIPPRQEEGLRRFFRRVQDLQARLQVDEVQPTGERDRLVARVSGEYTYRSLVTRVTERQPVAFRATFQHEGRRWRIAAIN